MYETQTRRADKVSAGEYLNFSSSIFRVDRVEEKDNKIVFWGKAICNLTKEKIPESIEFNKDSSIAVILD